MGSSWSSFIDRSQCVHKAAFDKWTPIAVVTALCRAQAYAQAAAAAEVVRAHAAEQKGDGEQSRSPLCVCLDTCTCARGRVRELMLSRIQFHDIFVDYSYIASEMLLHLERTRAPPAAAAEAGSPAGTHTHVHSHTHAQSSGPSSPAARNARTRARPRDASAAGGSPSDPPSASLEAEHEALVASVSMFKGLRDDVFDTFIRPDAPGACVGTRSHARAMLRAREGIVDAATSVRIRAVDVFAVLILMMGTGTPLVRLALLYLLCSSSHEWQLDVSPRAAWLHAEGTMEMLRAMTAQCTMEELHEMFRVVVHSMRSVGISVADIAMHVHDMEAAVAAMPRIPTLPATSIFPPRPGMDDEDDNGEDVATLLQAIDPTPPAETRSGGPPLLARQPSMRNGSLIPTAGPPAVLARQPSERSMLQRQNSERNGVLQRRGTRRGTKLLTQRDTVLLSRARIERLYKLFTNGLDDDGPGVMGVVLVRRALEIDAVAAAAPVGILLPGRVRQRFAKLAQAAAIQDELQTRDDTSLKIAKVASLALARVQAAQAGATSFGTARASASADQSDSQPSISSPRSGRRPRASLHAPPTSNVTHDPAAASSDPPAPSRTGRLSAAAVLSRALQQSDAAKAAAPTAAPAAEEFVLPSKHSLAAVGDYVPCDDDWLLAMVGTSLESPDRWRQLTPGRRKALSSIPGGRVVKQAAVLVDHHVMAETHVRQLSAEIAVEVRAAMEVAAELQAHDAAVEAPRELLLREALEYLWARLQQRPASNTDHTQHAGLLVARRAGPPQVADAATPAVGGAHGSKPAAASRHGAARRHSIGSVRDAAQAAAAATAPLSPELRLKYAYEILRHYHAMLTCAIPFSLFLDWTVCHPIPRFVTRQLCWPMGRIATYNGVEMPVPNADARSKQAAEAGNKPAATPQDQVQQLAKQLSLLGLGVSEMRRVRALLQQGAGADGSGISLERFRRTLMSFMTEFLVERREAAMLWNFQRSRATTREETARLGASPRLPPYASMTELQRKKAIQALFAVFDADGSDRIDIGEFSLGVASVMPGSGLSKLGLLFDVYDIDCDDEVGPNELQSIILAAEAMSGKLKARDKGMDDIERQLDLVEFARELAAALDVNGDGSITRDEFIQILRSEPLLYECFAASLNLPLGTLDHPLPPELQPKTGPVFDFAMLHEIRNAYSIDLSRNRGVQQTNSKDSRIAAGKRRDGKAADAEAGVFGLDVDDAGDAGGDHGNAGRKEHSKSSILDRAVDRHHFRRLLRDIWKCPDDALFLADRVFDYMDNDGSGSIDVRELYAGITSALRGSVEERANFFYSLFDMEGDGHLESSEILRMLLASAGRDNVSEADARRVLAKIDTDGSGTVEREEFLEAIHADPGILDALSRVFGSVNTAAVSLFAEHIEPDDGRGSSVTGAGVSGASEAEEIPLAMRSVSPAPPPGVPMLPLTDMTSVPSDAAPAGAEPADSYAAPAFEAAVTAGQQTRTPVRPVVGAPSRPHRVQRISITKLAVLSEQATASTPSVRGGNQQAVTPVAGASAARLPSSPKPQSSATRKPASHSIPGAAAPLTPRRHPTLTVLDTLTDAVSKVETRVEDNIQSLETHTERPLPVSTLDEKAEMAYAVRMARALAERPLGQPAGRNRPVHSPQVARRVVISTPKGSSRPAAAIPPHGMQHHSLFSPTAPTSASFVRLEPSQRKPFVYEDARGQERWYKTDPELPLLLQSTKLHAEIADNHREAMRHDRRVVSEAERQLMSKVAELIVRRRARAAEVRRLEALAKTSAAFAESAALPMQETAILPSSPQRGSVRQDAAPTASAVPKVISGMLRSDEYKEQESVTHVPVAVPLTVQLYGDAVLPSPRVASPRAAAFAVRPLRASPSATRPLFGAARAVLQNQHEGSH